ncbi:MAG: hypothetical protein K0R82_1367 [Flavipsychrobacter sp.]|jgi:hypothetical protein|nr:hypothetical protein [Flavipsychrobacter sp.]
MSMSSFFIKRLVSVPVCKPTQNGGYLPDARGGLTINYKIKACEEQALKIW